MPYRRSLAALLRIRLLLFLCESQYSAQTLVADNLALVDLGRLVKNGVG
jgi:hypothetical protein